MATARKARPQDSLSYDPELEADYFAQLPKTIIFDERISDGAYRLYSVLLIYCRRKETAWPGQETLANDLHRSVRQIHRLLTELKEIGLIDWQQNGQSSNRYYVYKAPLIQRTKAQSEPDRTKMSTLDRTKMSTLDRTKMSTESHEVESHKLEQHHADVSLKNLLMQAGFATSNADKLQETLAKNNRPIEYLERWLKYIKSEPDIKRPLGFLRSMIEENQNPPLTQREQEEARRKASWAKLPGYKANSDPDPDDQASGGNR
jgi:predicted transcriptional regulator